MAYHRISFLIYISIVALFFTSCRHSPVSVVCLKPLEGLCEQTIIPSSWVSQFEHTCQGQFKTNATCILTLNTLAECFYQHEDFDIKITIIFEKSHYTKNQAQAICANLKGELNILN